MSKASSIKGLEERIEAVVREHLAATRDAVTAAVARAFAEPVERPGPPARPARVSKLATPRRSPEELAALGERFCEEVKAAPGETMMTLAPRVGVTARALEVPVRRLRREGRIRTAGQRYQTRYFPTAATLASAS